MGRVKVKSVVEKDPNSSLNPILVRFEHAPVKPDADEALDLNNFFGTAVYETDTSKNAARDLSHLNRSAFDNRSRPSNSKGWNYLPSVFNTAGRGSSHDLKNTLCIVNFCRISRNKKETSGCLTERHHDLHWNKRV